STPSEPQEPLTLLEELTAATGRGLGFIRSRWFKSRSGVPATGSSKLPGKKAKKSGRAAKKSGKNKKRQRLLVEPERLTHLLLLDRLRRAGLEVDQAPNGCMALQKLQSEPPDAMLVSLPTGGITATELIAKARQAPGFL